MTAERPLVFNCAGERLVGVLHEADGAADLGVVVVVGGPQYRVGSHRQFVLMARALAASGLPVFRFDFRGMGDSSGDFRSFEHVEEDIRAAIDCFMSARSNLRRIVLLGLCDAASANLMYCTTDQRLAGMVLLNPWVRTESGEAKAYLKHYYWQRLLQPTFWRKVFSGQFAVGKSVGEFLESVRRAGLGGRNNGVAREGGDFISRMYAGFHRFGKPILFFISGRDLTAKEFVDLCASDTEWTAALTAGTVATIHLPDADHTLSSRAELDKACAGCVEWLDARIR